MKKANVVSDILSLNTEGALGRRRVSKTCPAGIVTRTPCHFRWASAHCNAGIQ